MSIVAVEPSKGTERVTVDLPVDDYTGLRYLAAVMGRKASMSALIRLAVKDLLAKAEAAEDAADMALIKKRLAASGGKTITTEELNARLADAL